MKVRGYHDTVTALPTEAELPVQFKQEADECKQDIPAKHW
jgi:hypothetical protein